tara:strand:- start:4787 stop:5815 length:1029 start_codon:yes stop_codon:yes gene_type:complete
MGRALGPEEYGILGALFSIFYILVTPSGTIQTVITKFISQFKAENEYGKIRSFLGLAFKKIFFYGLMFFIAFILSSRYIALFLKIPHTPVVALGVVLFLSFLYPILNGVLIGLQRFNWYSAAGVIQTTLKLGFGVLLVSLGFGVVGAVNALSLAAIVTILIVLIPIWFLFKIEKEKLHHLNIFRYGLFVLIGVEGLMLITNMDMFLVKHFFSALEAGYYAAASMLAKISWFASGALIAVMFPKISELHTKGENSSSILKNTLFYTVLISFSIVLIYFIAPTFVIRMLYGEKYLAVKGLIGYLSLGLAFFALNNVIAMYNFAIKRMKFVYKKLGRIPTNLFVG